MNDFEVGRELPAEGDDHKLGAMLLDDWRQRQGSALAMYRVHREASALDRYRLLTYRCPRRCLLLDVFNTPAGPAVYFPPFKLSPEQNERTDEGARVERTSDGVRRWIERAEMLAAFRGGLYLELNCDHVSRRPLQPASIADAIGAKTREVVIAGTGA